MNQRERSFRDNANLLHFIKLLVECEKRTAGSGILYYCVMTGAGGINAPLGLSLVGQPHP